MLSKIRALESTFTIRKATLLIGFLVLLSRVAGFARDILITSKFGLGDSLDIYLTAFRIPDTVFNLLVLGTLGVAFIPVFGSYYLKDRQRAHRIASSILNISLLTMTGVCVLLFIFCHPLTKLLVPGFDAEKLAKTIQITRIMLISPIIFTVSNIVSNILMSFKKFIMVNVAAIFYNIGIILGLFFLYPRYGLPGLAYGVLFGALLHLLIQVPELWAHGLRWQPIIDLKDTGVREIGRLFLPRIFGLDISFISLIIATILGSFLESGSIAAYNLGNNLQAAPIGILAISTAVATFPLLVELNAKKDTPGFIRSLQQAVRQILFFMIPVSVILLLERAYIVRLWYGHGKVDWSQTILLFNVLGMFTFSLFAQGLVPLLGRAFYARHNTKTPVIIGLASMAINAIGSFILAKMYGVVGIVAGFGIAAIFNALLLYICLHYSIHKESEANAPYLHELDRDVAMSTLKIVAASMLMGGGIYLALNLIEPFVNNHTVLGIFVQAGGAGLFGILIFLATSYWLRITESRDFVQSIAKKLLPK